MQWVFEMSRKIYKILLIVVTTVAGGQVVELDNLMRVEIRKVDSNWDLVVFREGSEIISIELRSDGFRLDTGPAEHLFEKRPLVSMNFREGVLIHNSVVFHRGSEYLYMLDVNQDFLYDLLSDSTLVPREFLVTHRTKYLTDYSDSFSDEYYGNFQHLFDPWTVGEAEGWVSLDLDAMTSFNSVETTEGDESNNGSLEAPQDSDQPNEIEGPREETP